MAIELIAGDFELDRKDHIGTGAWGDVYLGRQRSINRPVAVKILKKELNQNEEFVKHFRHEANTLARITDEHIVQVYSAGEYGGAYYFIMEYVHGISLAKFMSQGRKFTLPETVYVAESVAHALKAAWESPARIVHRDIKPSNIMVSYGSSIIIPSDQKRRPSDDFSFTDFNLLESKIKVMDFGLAKISAGIAESTLDGKIVGTPKYISPEQALGKPADIRADIYSLGIVIYEMQAGRIPFESDSVMGLIRRHIYDTPLSPRLFNDHLPGDLEAIILKCIQKDPADRYQTPDELLTALKSVRYPSVQPLPRQTETGKDSQTVLKIIPKRRSAYPVIGIALAVIIIALAGFIIATDKPGPAVPPMDQPAGKVNGLLGQARAALQLKEFALAKELLMQAAGQSHDSEELKKLIQEYNATQPCPPKDELVPVIKSLLKNARLEISADNFEKANFILSEAYFIDPCSPEIDAVFHELEDKKKSIPPAPSTQTDKQKVETLIREGRVLLQQKSAVEAERKFNEAYYLALLNPDIYKESGEILNQLRELARSEQTK